MNVYDFDKTIYAGDSTVDLFLWLMKRHPRMLLNLPLTAFSGVAYLMHIYTKTKMKQNFYRAFRYVKDLKKEVSLFWDLHLNKIYPWYYDQQKNDDLVISASPEFLIGEACKRLGIHFYMASVVDMSTGAYIGLNCHGEEKVRRYRERFGQEPINNFYSDSFSDQPLADISEKSYMIINGKITNWPRRKK